MPHSHPNIHPEYAFGMSRGSLASASRVDARHAPFLKWAGGKRWLVPTLAPLIDMLDGNVYFEPFLGSGAIFFASKAQTAVLSDINCELVNAFVAVRDMPHALIKILSQLTPNHETFYAVRTATPATKFGRAGRFIFLNRTAFNGLYRTNKNGKFNVPFGCKPGTRLCDENGLRSASRRLQGTRLMTCDFAESIRTAKANDLVYFDPPYPKISDRETFGRYHFSPFSWVDQQRLAQEARSLVEAGVHVIISNALHPDVAKLYPAKWFAAFALERATNMAALKLARGRVGELLVVSRSLLAAFHSNYPGANGALTSRNDLPTGTYPADRTSSDASSE